MSAEHDRRFMDLFTLVVGILAGIAFGIYFLSAYVSGRTQDRQVMEDPEYQRAVAERIAPLARLAVAGQDNSALTMPSAAPAAPVAATGSGEPLSGAAVYQSACIACHGQGIAGAPKYGDRTAWAPYLAKGVDVLHANALGGVQSAAGIMPPKGGRPDLPDQSILDAVDYMLEAVR